MASLIFNYTDYRKYLSDYFEQSKVKNPSFSHRSFCKLLGFTSPNYIKLLISGQRNLAPKSAFKIAERLGLKKKECDFFLTLVEFNQAETHEEKVRVYEKIAFFKSYQQVKNIDIQYYHYFSHWYYPAIREMIFLPDFREDVRWIKARLCDEVSEEEIKLALVSLLELDFIKYNDQRKLVPSDQNISTADEVNNISLLAFHKEMMRMAQRSLDETDHRFRDISSVTTFLDYKGFQETKKLLQDLRQDLNLKLSATKSPEAVYQINFQFFNLTKIPKSWEQKIK